VETLEQQILVIINRNHPLDSAEVRYHLSIMFCIDRSRNRVREVLKIMVRTGQLKRTWEQPNHEHKGKWLYNLPEYAEPIKRLPKLSLDPIVARMRAAHKGFKRAFCMGGRACKGRRP